MLRTMFATQVRDMQCGFKAVRRDVATALLPAVEDDGWFFDTELLLLAERNGLRIHQVPVDWIDDPDSRVHVVQTAMDDLARCVRMAWHVRTGAAGVDLGPRAAALDDDLGRSLVTFGVIGVAEHGRDDRDLPAHTRRARARSARTRWRVIGDLRREHVAHARFSYSRRATALASRSSRSSSRRWC